MNLSVDAKPDLSVVIPAYNEASRIDRSLEQTVEYLRARAGTFEIIVVDDGSSDQTRLVTQHFVSGHAHEPIQLIALQPNQGKGAALRAGVARTTGRRVLVMDADLATPLVELEHLWSELERGAQVVTGSRALVTSNVTRPQSHLRVYLGRAGNLWIRALAVPGIHDTQCGFKLFDGDVARTLYGAAREDRFGIDIEILCLALRRFHYKVSEVGVHWEHQDGSKVRPRDYLDVLVKVPQIVWSVMRG